MDDAKKSLETICFSTCYAHHAASNQSWYFITLMSSSFNYVAYLQSLPEDFMIYSEYFAGREILIPVYVPEGKIFTLQIIFST